MTNQLLKLSDARTAFFAVPPSVGMIRRWISDGINGIKLQAVRQGQKRYTYYLSQQAVEDFFAAVSGTGTIPFRRIDPRAKERHAAEAAIKRMKQRGWL